MPAPRWVDAGPRSAVSPGRMVEAEAANHAVLLYDIDGTVFATAAVCPHHSAWLSQGSVHGAFVDCPRHMGQFHIPTGRLTRGPACPDLRTYTVVVRDGRIWLDVGAAA